MFLAKLLVGNEVLMDRDKSPTKASECKNLTCPPIDAKKRLKYNTVTGYTGGSQVWIVYENGRAYPDYIVRYYRGSRDPNRSPFKNRKAAMKAAAKKQNSLPGSAVDDSDDDKEVIWEFRHNSGWKPYSDDHQTTLEDSYKAWVVKKSGKSSTVRIGTDEWSYEVDLNQMTQKNMEHSDGRERDVRRREV